MFVLNLALMGTQFQNADQIAAFLGKYGSEHAHQIAFNRDDQGNLQLVFTNDDGQLPNGATKLVQAAMLVNTSDKRSFLVTTQKSTAKLGTITVDEHRQIGKFFAEIYFSGTKKDVALLAKSNKVLANDGQVLYYADTGEGFQVNDVGNMLTDYVRARNTKMFIFQSGTAAIIDAQMLDENLVTGDKDFTMRGADTSVTIGQDSQLARGPKIQIGNAQINTLAYVKVEADKQTKMILLDSTTLEELHPQTFTGDYATANHNGDAVYMMTTLPSGPDVEDDITTVNVVTAEKFLENNSASSNR